MEDIDRILQSVDKVLYQTSSRKKKSPRPTPPRVSQYSVNSSNSKYGQNRINYEVDSGIGGTIREEDEEVDGSTEIIYEQFSGNQEEF